MLGEVVDVSREQVDVVLQLRVQDRVRVRRVDIVYRYITM